MTLVLELPASVEAALARRAAEQGTTPEDLVLADLKRLYPETAGEQANVADAMTTEERVRRFLAWTDSHDRTVPIIPLEAFDRENLYAHEDD